MNRYFRRLRRLKPLKHLNLGRKWHIRLSSSLAACLCVFIAASALAGSAGLRASAQQAETGKPVVVQPGAPGKPTQVLPPTTRGELPPASPADVQFMQGMIMHHAQAVEMTALIESHTENKELRTLGARISRSQSDEIKFMKRWLASRGQQVPEEMHDMKNMSEMHHMNHMNMKMSHDPMALMPGMLSAEQMDALRKAKGGEFDQLFLKGMIQHHGGALTMVKDLFDTAGAGQDAELFNFTTDVDSGQRAEIRIMQSMLEKKPIKDQK
ncbi:MAG: DUF305 domain-containing protein [Blastocatellia bacterium]|nr:DUF305 domain-containing protein [Blastocatellia bacterium]